MTIQIYYDFKKDLELSFLIYPEDYLDKIGKYFKLMNEIVLKDELFDQYFFIKSDNQELVKSVLSKDVKEFLNANHSYIANYKLETIEKNSILEFNAPFDETNIDHMEKVVNFMKKSIDNILNFPKK